MDLISLTCFCDSESVHPSVAKTECGVCLSFDLDVNIQTSDFSIKFGDTVPRWVFSSCPTSLLSRILLIQTFELSVTLLERKRLLMENNLFVRKLDLFFSSRSD